MSICTRPARINVKVLFILIVAVGVLLGGAAVGYKVRKRIIAERALAAGQTALERQDWREACKQLRQYLARYPVERTDILISYAEANLVVRPLEPENVAAAIGAYRRYLRHSPGEEKACHALADLYLQVRDFDEAAYIARQRLGADPNDVRAKLALARALIGLGRTEEARTQWLEPLVEAHPEQVDAHLLLSDIARQSRSAGPEAVQTWLDRAVDNNPQSARALLARAVFHQELARSAGAGSTTQPASGPAYDEAALADLEAADALRSKDPRVLSRAFELWLDRGNLDRAEAELKALEAVDAQSLADAKVEPEVLQLMKHTAAGRLALQRKATDEGGTIADRALAELTGSQRLPFLDLAIELYLEADRLEQARECLTELHKSVEARLPGDSTLATRLSVLEAAVLLEDPIANPFDAINRLREVTRVDPQNVRAWKLLADGYLRTGQELRALSALEQRVQRVPQDRESRRILARVLLDIDLGRASQHAARIQAQDPDDLQAKLIRIGAAIRAIRAGVEGVDTARLAEELTRLRELHPAETEVRVLLAVLAQVEDRPEDALTELRHAVQECDDKVMAAIELANLAQEQGRIDEAVEAARRAGEFRQDLAAPRVRLAQLHESAQRPDEARAAFDRAVADLKGEEKLQAQLALSRFLLSHNTREEGIGLLRQLAAEHPLNAQLRLALLRLPEIQSNARQAQKLVDELHRMEGDEGLLWPVEQARLWLATYPSPEHQQEIIDRLTRVVEEGSGGPDPVLLLAAAHLKRGEVQKAETVYRRSLDTQPVYTAVVEQLLTLLESQGRFGDASAVLERLPKDIASLSEHRIRIGVGLRDFDAAIGELKRRIGADPDDAASRVTLARLVYAQNKDTEAAFRLLDEAESLSPDLPAILTGRVAILQGEGRHDEALTLLDREVARRNDFATYQLRATVHAAAGRVDLAEKDYRHLVTFTDSAVLGYEALCGFYGRAGRMDEAIAAAEEGLKLAPEARGLRSLLAAALLTRAEPDARQRGRQIVDDLLKQEPNDADLLLLKAETLLQSGAPDSRRQAAGLLERIISLDPRRVRPHLLLIEMASQDGDRALVWQRIVHGLEANPDDERLLLAQATLEAESNHLPRAEEIARRIVAKQPRHVAALNLLVNLALRRGDTEAAAGYNAEVLALDPDNETASLARAAILTAEGKPEEALAAVEAYRKTEAGTKSVNACLAVASLHRRAQRMEEAGQALDVAEKLAPAAPAVLRERMVWFSDQKRFDDLLVYVNNPPTGATDVTGLMDLAATILASSGEAAQIQSAMALYRRIVETAPERVSAHIKLGQLSYAFGDLSAAEEAYRRALDLQPDHPQALNDLAWILGIRLDRVEEGFELAKRGVGRHPDDPHLRDTCAAILIRLDRFEEAADHLELCLKLVAEDPALRRTRIAALRRLAEALVKVDRSAEARRHYVEIIRLDDDPEYVDLSSSDRAEIQSALEALPRVP